MAKSVKADSNEILDEVNSTASKNETTTKVNKSAKKEVKKESDKLDDVDDRNVFVAFVYDHPWITMFIFYVILTGLVRIWGWATIVFLAVPVFCFLRVWLLSRNTNSTISTENHERLAWWAKVGLFSSSFGLASVIILDALGWLQVFGS